MESKARIRVAHLSGPNATIQNTPPLVTSNKGRLKHGLEPMRAADGTVLRHDALRQQRLAAPVKVYVEQFSAHPLERDAADLYGPPDGYIDVDGVFHKEQRSASDKPVYEIELKPEDGLYPLPYVALQKDGKPWEEECAVAFGAGRAGAAGLLPRRLAQFRGYRSHGDRRRRQGEHDLLAGDGRFLSPAAAGRLSQGLARGASHRCRRRRYSARDARQGFLPLQAAPSRLVAAAAGARARHQHGAKGDVERAI